MITTDPYGLCPTVYTWTLTNQDGSAIDTNIFTFDGTAQTLSTYTTDFAYFTSGPSYPLRAHVAHNGYAIAGTFDFNVLIGIDCSSATFDPLSIADMSHSVLGTADTQVLNF